MSDRFIVKHKYALLLTSFVLVVVALAAVFTLSQNKMRVSQVPLAPPSVTQTPQRVEISGEVVCLPHKDTSGPQTLECAIGLMDSHGKYYALDASLMSQTPPGYTTGDRIKASGVLTPIEYLSSDHWKKYNVIGIFSLTDSVVVLE